MISSSLLIEHQCPQCGAPAVLEETDRLFTCGFCKVKSFLLEKNCFSYILPSAAAENRDVVWFPYWRFKGAVYTCVHDGVKNRFVDVSQLAIKSSQYPFSLGLRSQTLKLKFATSEIKGKFIKPTMLYEQAIAIFEDSINIAMPKPIFYQEFIGEAHSLIYSPFYLDGKVIDAVLEKSLPSVPAADFQKLADSGVSSNQEIKFVPTLCPQCGWDLHGERDSLVLTCGNCDSAWRTGGGALKKVAFRMIPEQGDDIVYLPFWRIKPDIMGILLDSYADVVKLANLPKAVKKEWADIPFYFWAPAFKAAPQAFLRFGNNMTLTQPMDKMIPEMPKKTHPVTLPVTEAVESLVLILAGFIKPRNKILPRLERIKISPKKFMLVYVPFHEKHHELVHPKYQLAVSRNMLKMAKNL